MRNLGHWLSSWFSLVWFEVLLEAIFLCRIVHHMWGNSGHNPDLLSDYFINTGLGISHMAYSWLWQSAHTKMEKFPQNVSHLPQPWLSHRRQCSQTNTNIQRPSHSPWPSRPSYHVIRGRSDHHEQKGPSHTSTELTQLKSPAHWLTRTASHLSTKWVWAKGCIYFRGLYGPRWGICHAYLYTPGHQATTPSGRSSRQTSWVGCRA